MANGPGDTVWVPSGSNQAVGATTLRLPSGTYKKRGVYKAFVAAISGKDVRMRAVGQSSVRADYADCWRDDGAYCVFGAVDSGNVDLIIESSPTGAGTWSAEGTVTVAIDASTNIVMPSPLINCWYAAYPTGALSASIDEVWAVDFPIIKSMGIDAVHVQHDPTWQKNLLFQYARQNGLKLGYVQRSINDRCKNLTGPDGELNGNITSRHNLNLIAVDDVINDDDFYMGGTEGAPVKNYDTGYGLGSVVENSEILAEHQSLLYLGLPEEPNVGVVDYTALGVEILAMMVRANFPALRLQASIGADDSESFEIPYLQTQKFLDWTSMECYPFATRPTPTSAVYNMPYGNFSRHWAFNTSGSQRNCYDFMRYVATKDTSRPCEFIFQCHLYSGSPYRLPQPNELAALVYQAGATGVKLFTYFIWTDVSSSFPGLYDKGRNPNSLATINKIKEVNTKLHAWFDAGYGDLILDAQASDLRVNYANAATTYEVNGGVMGAFHKADNSRYVIIVNTNCNDAADVACRVILYPSGSARYLEDVVTGKVWKVNNGLVTVTLKAGDAGMYEVH